MPVLEFAQAPAPTTQTEKNLRSVLGSISPLFNDPARTPAKQLKRSFARMANSYNASSQLFRALEAAYPDKKDDFQRLRSNSVYLSEIIQALSVENRMGKNGSEIYAAAAPWFKEKIQDILDNSELQHLVGEKQARGLVYGLTGVKTFEIEYPETANAGRAPRALDQNIDLALLFDRLRKLNVVENTEWIQGKLHKFNGPREPANLRVEEFIAHMNEQRALHLAPNSLTVSAA